MSPKLIYSDVSVIVQLFIASIPPSNSSKSSNMHQSHLLCANAIFFKSSKALATTAQIQPAIILCVCFRADKKGVKAMLKLSGGTGHNAQRKREKREELTRGTYSNGRLDKVRIRARALGSTCNRSRPDCCPLGSSFPDPARQPANDTRAAAAKMAHYKAPSMAWLRKASDELNYQNTEEELQVYQGELIPRNSSSLSQRNSGVIAHSLEDYSKLWELAEEPVELEFPRSAGHRPQPEVSRFSSTLPKSS